MARARGLLVKVQGNGASFAAAAGSLGFGAAGVRKILDVPVQPALRGFGAAATQPASWFAIETSATHGNPWDDAHQLLDQRGPFGAAGGPQILAVEPDIEQAWVRTDERIGGVSIAGAASSFDPQDSSGGKAVVAGRLAWHLDPDFSQFRAARTRVGARQQNITVAHLDTGYDKTHKSVPTGIVAAKQRNFMPGEPPNDASDRAPQGGLLSNRGHGAGTMSILAGNLVPGNAPGWTNFTDFLGAAPGVNVIPVRIADWVVRFTTSTMVAGFNYARAEGVQVLTMSMGGLSSAALVDAVNAAYEAGIVLVTAGGNNISGFPSPKSIVFPARYKRVIAACGVMGDGRAYAD